MNHVLMIFEVADVINSPSVRFISRNFVLVAGIERAHENVVPCIFFRAKPV